MKRKRTHTATQVRARGASALVFSALLALGALPHAVVAGDVPGDAAISDAVADRLLMDRGVDGHDVQVVTVDGVATLSGSVNNILAQQRAAAIARSVKGVRAVIDRIDVDAPEVADERLASDVRAALTVNPRAEAFEVRVSAHDGEVRLQGAVGSWQERALVDNLARGVRGVVAVRNDLQVQTTARNAQEIREDVRAALAWDRYVDDALVDVDVVGRTVVLRGALGSAAERERAIRNAWVKGVEEVDAKTLVVSAAAGDDRVRSRPATPDDARIRAAIEDALLLDPRVASTDVKVSVEDGVATLRGSVDYLGAHEAALQDALDATGVLWVRDRLRIAPARAWTDEEIVSRVEAAWARDPYVSLLGLSASVRDGALRIEGTADDTFERARAETLAHGVPGVFEVNNDINVVSDFTLSYNPYVDARDPQEFEWYTVTTTTTRSDTRIEREVRDEIRWSPFVDGDRVNVSVDDGVVTLTGTLDTWSARRAATENALEGGAVKVVNKISVSDRS